MRPIPHSPGAFWFAAAIAVLLVNFAYNLAADRAIRASIEHNRQLIERNADTLRELQR